MPDLDTSHPQPPTPRASHDTNHLRTVMNGADLADRWRTLGARAQHALHRLAHAAHLDEIEALVEQPTVTLDLMLRETEGNAPFFAGVVREFFDEARAPHPRLPLVGRLSFGVALCRLPDRFEQYFALLDGSARRNCRKAERDGYRFERIDFNAHLDDIAAIRASAPSRQGPMPEALLHGAVRPIADPPSRTNVHDYPWFGVLKGAQLVAYGSCLVAGEVCLINHLFGHAAHQEEGVVPALIVGIAGYVYEHYPRVRYLGYDTFFGAAPSLRRFKRKLGFGPFRVHWELGERRRAGEPRPVVPSFVAAAHGDVEPARVIAEVPAPLDYQLLHRLHPEAPLSVEPVTGARFHYLESPAALALLLPAARRRFGAAALVRAAAKLATARRHYYCVVQDGAIVSDGWVMRGACRHYPIAPGDAVIGPTWTDPAHRGHGLATFALRHALNALRDRGALAVWIDTSRDNVGMQKAIARAGFGPPVALHLRAETLGASPRRTLF